MKKLAFALSATLLLAYPAFVHAQDAAAPPTAPDPSSAGAGGGGGGGGAAGGKGGKMKELMQSCRKQAKAQGLTPNTHEMRQAVSDCVTKEHPGMAGRMKCRTEGMDKGMKPGSDELKSYVKECMKSAG